jgi:uncharacterized damage-inducible protein DinB
MLSTISSLLERDINKLIEEINLYGDEKDLWKIKDGILNSSGNLTLHLIGNLNHFIGATLGNTGYVRTRDKEFSDKNVPAATLIEELKKTSDVVKTTLAGLKEEDLEKDFPLPINNKIYSTSYILVFLVAHFNYHLGQINYHRRMI